MFNLLFQYTFGFFFPSAFVPKFHTVPYINLCGAFCKCSHFTGFLTDNVDAGTGLNVGKDVGLSAKHKKAFQ